MKTNKHKTLLLAKKTNPLHARHLVGHFQYAPGTARSYLSHLGRQGLLERTRGGHRLTKKGVNRLRYFAIFGCPRPGCPFCNGKRGFITCPDCGHGASQQEMSISKAKDYVVALRQAGVYCNLCTAFILDELQAQRLGIKREE
jgi:hypothetical protein